jgi:hypothetical protein
LATDTDIKYPLLYPELKPLVPLLAPSASDDQITKGTLEITAEITGHPHFMGSVLL